ncbi:MAG: arginase family protein [Chitinophagaceae bacterium]|nr:arginase family protein [Chitinophagaceae bacterium]
MIPNFKNITKEDILPFTHIRKYETKLGEVIGCCESTDTKIEEAIQQSDARYVIFGIPEDAGVQANGGIGGARTLWPAFLNSFLNIQSNSFLPSGALFIAGAFDFSEEIRLINATAPNLEERIIALRALVENIDEQVEDMVKIICRNKKIPVIVGGGHNNAYGAIKGSSKGLYAAGIISSAQVNVINLDAHTDYRVREGRHSGNGFRYAHDDGYLHKYFIVGVHENYMQENVLRELQGNSAVDYITYEDIFLRDKFNFIQSVARATDFVKGGFTGIELDMDSIENVVSSAMTPSGVSAANARTYVSFIPTELKIAYLHICEGATTLDNTTSSGVTGKLVSYLVTDFVKSHHLAEKSGFVE